MLLAALATALTAALGCHQAPSTEATTAPQSTAIRHVDPAAARQLLASSQVLVLDIRTPGEFARGHIAGATNIDFLAPSFAQRLGGLDRQREYLVHCATGGRSTKSLTVFTNLGFRSIAHLDGGFRAWEKAGEPVAK